MSYNSSAYQKAINILERRREKAALEANARKAEILSRLPEIDSVKAFCNRNFNFKMLF